MKLIGDNSSIKTLFIGKNSSIVELEEKVDIILLPSLYWFKIEELPVKTASQAQKLAPSVFDGSIVEGVYSYQAIKQDDRFWLFAYSDTEIAELFDTLGLKPSSIRNVYFAQNECQNIEEAIKLDNEETLTCKNEVVSILPAQYLSESQTVEAFLHTLQFSKHKVSLNLYQNAFLNDKEISRLMILSIVFIVIYLGAYILEKQDNKALMSQEFALSKKYDLPATSFQLKSLKKSLESKQKREYNFRNKFKKLLQLPLKKGEYILSIDTELQKATLQIVLTNPKNAEIIKKYLQGFLKVTKAKVVDNKFYLGVKYE